MGSARQTDQACWRARLITIQKSHIRRSRYINLEFFEQHVLTSLEEQLSVPTSI